MSTPISSPLPPDLRTLLNAHKAEILNELNCHQVGTIESYDYISQTASVRIAMLRTIGTEQVPYPVLTDCPVAFPSGGTAAITFPLTKGDPCLVVFNDRDIDNWFVSGATTASNTPRTHSLSDGVVLPGVRNASNKLDASGNSLKLVFGDNYVDIGAGVTIHGSTSFVVLGPRITISNASTSLKAVLGNLCDVLTAWVNTGGSTPNAATLSAIASAKALANSLLD